MQKQKRAQELERNLDREEKQIVVQEAVDEEMDASVRAETSGQWGDPTDAPVVEISFEELMEMQEEFEGDDTLGDLIDTAHTDGSTENVQMAMDQGLVYTPPFDPPVIPSDDLQGAEIAAGFASSIEDDMTDGALAAQIEGDDFATETEIRRALRHNAETTHLDDVRIYVRDSVAYLRGTVFEDDEIGLVEEFVRDLDLVDELHNELEVEA